MASFTEDITGALNLTNIQWLQVGPEENTTLSHNIGTIDLSSKTEAVTLKEFTLLLNLDRSGSMSEKVKDVTLLGHAQHTIKNMINFMLEDEEYSKIKMNIVINYFDNENKTIMMENEKGELSSIIPLTEETSKKLIEKICRIEPRGTTNISAACEKMSEIREKINGPCLHILFTDGMPNQGHTSVGGIGDRIPQNCDNVFFGFGADHCESLLSSLANSKNGEYAFVDNIENAGIVYGEYLCNTLKKLVTEVKVTLQNAEIYCDSKWTNEIEFRKLASGMTKTLYVRHAWDLDKPIEIQLFYKHISGTSSLKKMEIVYTADKPTQVEDRNVDVWKKHHSVKVIETLNKVLNNREGMTVDTLVTMLDEFKAYMKENNLEEDLLMISLCDDLIIAIKLYDIKKGKILIKARLNALVNQLSYLPNNCDIFKWQTINDGYGRRGVWRRNYSNANNCDSDDDDIDSMIPCPRNMLSSSSGNFRRASSTMVNGSSICDDDYYLNFPKPLPVLSHQLSKNSQSTFTTPSQQRIQRSLSVPK